jgi:hypothetical protein
MATPYEERIAILKMIEEDKINAEQGLKLLEALASTDSVKAANKVEVSNSPMAKDGNGRFFRVVVTNTATGKAKAMVTLPMNLVQLGLRIGAHFSPGFDGMDMDELAETLKSTSHGKIIDVLDEEDNEHVEIFID